MLLGVAETTGEDTVEEVDSLNFSFGADAEVGVDSEAPFGGLTGGATDGPSEAACGFVVNLSFIVE